MGIALHFQFLLRRLVFWVAYGAPRVRTLRKKEKKRGGCASTVLLVACGRQSLRLRLSCLSSP